MILGRELCLCNVILESDALKNICAFRNEGQSWNRYENLIDDSKFIIIIIIIIISNKSIRLKEIITEN